MHSALGGNNQNMNVFMSHSHRILSLLTQIEDLRSYQERCNGLNVIRQSRMQAAFDLHHYRRHPSLVFWTMKREAHHDIDFKST